MPTRHNDAIDSQLIGVRRLNSVFTDVERERIRTRLSKGGGWRYTIFPGHGDVESIWYGRETPFYNERGEQAGTFTVYPEGEPGTIFRITTRDDTRQPDTDEQELTASEELDNFLKDFAPKEVR